MVVQMAFTFDMRVSHPPFKQCTLTPLRIGIWTSTIEILNLIYIDTEITYIHIKLAASSSSPTLKKTNILIIGSSQSLLKLDICSFYIFIGTWIPHLFHMQIVGGSGLKCCRRQGWYEISKSIRMQPLKLRDSFCFGSFATCKVSST